MGPGSTTLTCSQSGQAAAVSGQPDGLLQTMVRVIAPLIARAKKQDAMIDFKPELHRLAGTVLVRISANAAD